MVEKSSVKQPRFVRGVCLCAGIAALFCACSDDDTGQVTTVDGGRGGATTVDSGGGKGGSTTAKDSGPDVATGNGGTSVGTGGANVSGAGGANVNDGGTGGASPTEGGIGGASSTEGGTGGASPTEGGTGGANVNEGGTGGANVNEGGTGGANTGGSSLDGGTGGSDAQAEAEAATQPPSPNLCIFLDQAWGDTTGDAAACATITDPGCPDRTMGWAYDIATAFLARLIDSCQLSEVWTSLDVAGQGEYANLLNIYGMILFGCPDVAHTTEFGLVPTGTGHVFTSTDIAALNEMYVQGAQDALAAAVANPGTFSSDQLNAIRAEEAWLAATRSGMVASPNYSYSGSCATDCGTD